MAISVVENKIIKSLNKLDRKLFSCFGMRNIDAETMIVNAFISESVETPVDGIACRFLFKVNGQSKWVYTGYNLVGGRFILYTISPDVAALRFEMEEFVNASIEYVDELGKNIDLVEYTLVGRDGLSTSRDIKMIHKGIYNAQLSFFIAYGSVKNRNPARQGY